jgi:hypothetical protein
MWAVKLHCAKLLLCDVHVYEEALGYMGSTFKHDADSKRKEKVSRMLIQGVPVAY